MSELELLTFWLSHLYGRCTRSVSVATPAYYAHWAARRGKVLLSAGAHSSQLREISEKWAENGTIPGGMYFI
jgi:eukaryotic translation initiation factor 2C